MTPERLAEIEQAANRWHETDTAGVVLELIAALHEATLSQSQKRDLIDLLDEFGDKQFWLGRYTEITQRGSPMMKPVKVERQSEATRVRERFKGLLFP